jgi:hypothetical protein
MRRFLLLGALLTCIATPVQAGHGTIRETDTQIFVEYYGDAAEFDSHPAETGAPAEQPSPAVPRPSAAAVQPAIVQPAAAQAGEQTDEAATPPRPATPRQQTYEPKAIPVPQSTQRELALELRRLQRAERSARQQQRQSGIVNND